MSTSRTLNLRPKIAFSTKLSSNTKLAIKILLTFSILAYLIAFNAAFSDSKNEICPNRDKKSILESRNGSAEFYGRKIRFDSYSFKNNEKSYSYMYCIKNEHPYSIVHFDWHDKDTKERYYKSTVRPRRVADNELKRATAPDHPKKRRIKYGRTRKYGKTIDEETVFNKSRSTPKFLRVILAQFSPEIDLLRIISNTTLLFDYISYLNSEKQSAPIQLGSRASIWLPIEGEAVSSYLKGNITEEENKNYRYFKLYFGAISEVTSSTPRSPDIKIGAFASVPGLFSASRNASLDVNTQRLALSSPVMKKLSIRIRSTSKNWHFDLSRKIGKRIVKKGQFQHYEQIGTLKRNGVLYTRLGTVELLLDDEVIAESPFEALLSKDALKRDGR